MPNREEGHRNELALADQVDPILHLSISIIEQELWRSNGNVSAAAQMLAVDPKVLRHRIYDVPSLMQTMVEIVERKLDTVEEKMWEAAIRGHVPAMRFMLGTIGQHRGYAAKSTGPPQVNLTLIQPEIGEDLAPEEGIVDVRDDG